MTRIISYLPLCDVKNFIGLGGDVILLGGDLKQEADRSIQTRAV